MMKETRVISRSVARRMAIVAQDLAGPRPRADTEGIMDVIGRLGCLQLDPINIGARSHLLVLKNLPASGPEPFKQNRAND